MRVARLLQERSRQATNASIFSRSRQAKTASRRLNTLRPRAYPPSLPPYTSPPEAGSPSVGSEKCGLAFVLSSRMTYTRTSALRGTATASGLSLPLPRNHAAVPSAESPGSHRRHGSQMGCSVRWADGSIHRRTTPEVRAVRGVSRRRDHPSGVVNTCVRLPAFRNDDAGRQRGCRTGGPRGNV